MRKIKAYAMPALLSVCIASVGFRRAAFHNDQWACLPFNGDAVIVILYLVWMLYETCISGVDAVQNKKVSDYGTKQFYGFSHSLTILTALWFPPLFAKPGMYQCAGFIIFLTGVIFRIWAIRTLGQYYSHTVRTIAQHRIVDTGPYAFLRHPAYAGMIAAHIGITLFFCNYITAAVFVILLVPSIIVRILVEEKMLMELDGYAAFAKTRKRLVPFLW